jgi:hypothetical protein
VAIEKTTGAFPPWFGYPVHSSDVWAINYMLHNETPVQEQIYVTCEIDFVAADSPLGQSSVNRYLDMLRAAPHPATAAAG